MVTEHGKSKICRVSQQGGAPVEQTVQEPEDSLLDKSLLLGRPSLSSIQTCH